MATAWPFRDMHEAVVCTRGTIAMAMSFCGSRAHRVAFLVFSLLRGKSERVYCALGVLSEARMSFAP